MKIIGEKLFARDAQGRLVSRIGTMFFRTPGLVTRQGAHVMQRLLWLETLSKERKLTPAESDAELAESVDLVFTDDHILIRPNPDRMDLAFKADEELQKMVSKRVIRFLNTDSAKVRRALRERGENWRMARHPISQEDMAMLITSSRTAIENRPIYYYNHATGTRFITPGSYAEIESLPADEFRRHILEITKGMNARNRLGRPEIDIFPTTTPIDVRRAFRELAVNNLDDAALKTACSSIARAWRMSIPAELREEANTNFDWRNEMCHTLTRGPNDTAAEEQELVAGIAPEFYRQIEWLPGARIDRGEVIFDTLYEEAAKTSDPELAAICDTRVKSFLFNTTRLFGSLDYINIGRIAKSLARHPVEGNRRGYVYILQYRETGKSEVQVCMIRLQKWGIAERLDEGKDLLTAIIETDEYSDYILDRRLMCKQLGMNLPQKIGHGHFTERYQGDNKYKGFAIRTAYFVRSYIHGIASDKVPPAKFHNPAFAAKFAELMGEAAALDMIVGRRSTVTNSPLFDQNYEVVRIGEDGLPAEIMLTDHAGSFTDYERPYEEYVGIYASAVLRRLSFVNDKSTFVSSYVEGFKRKLEDTQNAYRARRKAFDNLFIDRPYDTNGSGAYRWACALRRLDGCNPANVAQELKKAIGC
jgi:hypothetical protein